MKAEIKGLEHNIAPNGGVYNDWEFKPCKLELSIDNVDEYSFLKNLFDSCWDTGGINHLANHLKAKNLEASMREITSSIRKEFGRNTPGM